MSSHKVGKSLKILISQTTSKKSISQYTYPPAGGSVLCSPSTFRPAKWSIYLDSIFFPFDIIILTLVAFCLQVQLFFPRCFRGESIFHLCFEVSLESFRGVYVYQLCCIFADKQCASPFRGPHQRPRVAFELLQEPLLC